MHCRLCKEYIEETDDCNLCMFELDESKFFSKSKFDILDLKEEDGWEHMQIIDRLHSCDVECLWADIWYDNNMAILVGVRETGTGKIARVLGVHEECIYPLLDYGLVVLNLFEEKYLRGLLE